MNVVMFCSTVWMFWTGPTALNTAKIQVETSYRGVIEAGCEKPREVSDQLIEYYKTSNKYKLNLINKIEELRNWENYAQIKPEVDPIQDIRSGREKHCHYWFERIAPLVLQLKKGRCWEQ